MEDYERSKNSSLHGKDSTSDAETIRSFLNSLGEDMPEEFQAEDKDPQNISLNVDIYLTGSNAETYRPSSDVETTALVQGTLVYGDDNADEMDIRGVYQESSVNIFQPFGEQSDRTRDYQLGNKLEIEEIREDQEAAVSD